MWSWVLYDFSNTIFAISILTYFYPIWLASELGGVPRLVNAAVTISSVFVVLTAPVLGLSPTSGRSGCRTSWR